MSGQFIKYLLVIFALSIEYVVQAQQPVPVFADSLASRLKYYAKQKGDGLLYAHFDKTIYANNEHVWFTAYLLKEQDEERDSVVSVLLVNDSSHSILLEDRFLITGGVSPGHLLLSDSIPTGDYTFFLYTDKVIKSIPCNIFVQRVHIRNMNSTPSDARLKFSIHSTSYNDLSASRSIAGAGTGVIVKFYPEGGALSAGLMNTVGWEAKTRFGSPLQVTGILYKNGVAVDTISTGPYGMGVFKLRPEESSHYVFRLADTTACFELPSVVTDRPVLFIPEAVADDTLNVTIRNKWQASFFLVIHNYGDLFFLLPVRSGPEGMTFKIALSDLPKGIAAVTLLDSLQRPCAERLFFAHYDRRNRVSIVTDHSAYEPGDSASVCFQIRTSDGRPGYGMVSVSIVQASRLSLRNKNNIQNWVYLNHELGSLPFKEDCLGCNSVNPDGTPRPEDKEYLEDVLRIKGWRNYHWAELSRVTPLETPIAYDSLHFTGTVTRSGRPLRKPVSVVLMKGRDVSLLDTDEKGAFRISYADLVSAENKKIYLVVNGDNRGAYKITIKDPFAPVSRSVSAMQRSVNESDFEGIELSRRNDWSAGDEDSKGWKKIGNLKEVVVKAGRNNSFYATRKRINACGDYVCRYGFLDCPYHAGEVDNTAPVTGNSYKVFDGTGADGNEIFHSVLYQECVVRKPETGSIELNGIYYAIDFYRDGGSGQEPLSDEYVSTLYWKHVYRISPDGNLPIRFRIGNNTGLFKIIVQGIGEKDVLYGEGDFLVR